MLRREYTKEFFKNNKWNTFLGVLVNFMHSALNIIVSWYLQVIIDVMTRDSNFTFANLIYLFVIFMLLIAVVSVTSAISYPQFLAKAMKQYKEYAFKKLLAKNMASFSTENTSTYISAFTNDMISIEDKYLKNIFSLIQYVVMFVGAFGLMFYYSVSMSVIVIFLSLLPLIVSMSTGNKLAAKEEIVSSKNERYVSTAKDILSGFTVVKSFKAEAEVEEMYAESNTNLEIAKKDRNRTNEIISSLGNFSQIATQIGTMLIGTWFVLNDFGNITPGIIMAFTNVINFVMMPIARMPEVTGQMKSANALIDKLAANLEHNVQEKGTDLSSRLEASIVVEDLDFAYDDEKTVLKGVSTIFQAGKSYAVVGGSGSGKSTLLNLLMGSYKNYDGSIAIDGTEIREVNPSSLYDMVVLIQQNVFIFDATIRDNITMFRDFPDAEVSRVIALSGLDKLIAEKGEGYLAGENGNKLSGGERQRVAIARSLLSNNSVLLVDEATSSLDNETAHNVSQAILDLEDLTRIVVTHRLDANLLAQYDGLVVMKDGEIVEEGRFQDLMDRKEYFYSLYVVSQ